MLDASSHLCYGNLRPMAKGLGLEILDVFIKGFLIRRADGIHRQDWAGADAPRRLSRGVTLCIFGAESWGNSADLSGWWLSPTPLKNDGVRQLGMMKFPTEWKVIKFHGSKPPTSCFLLFLRDDPPIHHLFSWPPQRVLDVWYPTWPVGAAPPTALPLRSLALCLRKITIFWVNPRDLTKTWCRRLI